MGKRRNEVREEREGDGVAREGGCGSRKKDAIPSASFGPFASGGWEAARIPYLNDVAE